jgi:hypothetical protein
MESAELGVPQSRVAAALKGTLDVAHAVRRPVFLDVENVPTRGPFVLVGNHQLLGMQDLPTLVRGLEVRRGVRVRGLADRFHFRLPLWRDLLVRMGAVPGTRSNCAALLAAGEPVLVFPGGAREVYKRRGQRYELLWGKRTGFARMAIDAGCPYARRALRQGIKAGRLTGRHKGLALLAAGGALLAVMRAVLDGEASSDAYVHHAEGRSFGSAVVSGDSSAYWVYAAGPLAGAVVAVGCAAILRGRAAAPTARLAASGSPGR